VKTSVFCPGSLRLLKTQTRHEDPGVRAACPAGEGTVMRRGPLCGLRARDEITSTSAGDAVTGGIENGVLDTEQYLFPQAESGIQRGKATAFVTAMKGCDKRRLVRWVPTPADGKWRAPYAEIVREWWAVAVGVRG